MAHGDAREGKRRGNRWTQWVASTLHTTSEHGASSITTADAHTSAASSRLNWRPLADLNGLVRFAERLNLVFARVPSHFNWPLTYLLTYLLTPWCRVLLEKLTGLQLVKKFSTFYGTRRFITASQASANCPYPGPAQSSPHTHIPPPGDPS